ncbi:MAG: M23 family metallopeptidase [Firmicutes bacterium]|uniref:Stage II sporulation protein Q n=1 Tax=Melghirimyces thermohalophilus TaxID=1236220 RepID=A0A1G6MDQ3_9BACL|nr:M23 family metallopeptidase [Melghirimyces thermohalophilus]MDA8354591.1 M23 family metallopeptidase [Bacillota bacterium]SDC53407.1 stage II sporulation protein Q [Melghirimyces thermohalophilus]
MKPEDRKPTGSVEKIPRLKWKRLLAKKWFFPAVYLAAAALILSLVWWYQNTQDLDVTKTNTGLEELIQEETVPTENTAEKMKLPVADDSQAEQAMGFYQEAGSEKSKEASLVQYDNSFWPHSGYDFARKDGKAFDVNAAMSGKVLRVEENPLTGHLVEIKHKDGLVTVYQSLSQVGVKAGDTVDQGDKIAEAGRNKFEKEAGVHLHFEVRKDNKTVDPGRYVNQ